jgi:3-oxoacyl-[acyl-carrier-protein] synthase-1
MGARVAITGMGIVSAIGMDSKENLDSLINQRHGISVIENIETRLRESILVGEIKKSNEELLAILGLPEKNIFSRTAMLGAIAALEAIRDAGIDPKESTNTGFINATTVAGMDMTERYFFDYLDDSENRRYIQSHDAGNSTRSIADYIGLEGFVTTISTACSSAANAIMLGARMIANGRLDRVIVGGTDALSKFTMNGFNTLMILSDTYNTPFDDNRKGLNLGEGAAYLVLESEASYTKRNKKPLAFVAGYANANDAFHQTASSDDGEGAFLAMKKAFEIAGLKPQDIDYINVHGTATPNNDLSEGRAIINLFGNEVPLFSSTKPFTGHTLAAAASVEAIYSVFALTENIIFPNLNFKNKMKEFDLIPNTQLLNKEVKNVLSNSFGFGGNCSSVIFSKYE